MRSFNNSNNITDALFQSGIVTYEAAGQYLSMTSLHYSYTQMNESEGKGVSEIGYGVDWIVGVVVDVDDILDTLYKGQRRTVAAILFTALVSFFAFSLCLYVILRKIRAIFRENQKLKKDVRKMDMQRKLRKSKGIDLETPLARSIATLRLLAAKYDIPALAEVISNLTDTTHLVHSNWEKRIRSGENQEIDEETANFLIDQYSTKAPKKTGLQQLPLEGSSVVSISSPRGGPHPSLLPSDGSVLSVASAVAPASGPLLVASEGGPTVSAAEKGTEHHHPHIEHKKKLSTAGAGYRKEGISSLTDQVFGVAQGQLSPIKVGTPTSHLDEPVKTRKLSLLLDDFPPEGQSENEKSGEHVALKESGFRKKKAVYKPPSLRSTPSPPRTFEMTQKKAFPSNTNIMPSISPSEKGSTGKERGIKENETTGPGPTLRTPKGSKQTLPATTHRQPVESEFLTDQNSLAFLDLSLFCRNVFRMQELKTNPLLKAVFASIRFLQLDVALDINMPVLTTYLNMVQASYHVNPYHTVMHAADVVLSTTSLIANSPFLAHAPKIDLFALLIAAAVHDVDHPGFNNGFLVKISHPLAILYNDTSVLENHHAAVAFQFIGDHQFLTSQTVALYRQFRACIISIVLATDMQQHFSILEELTDLRTARGLQYSVDTAPILMRLLIKMADIGHTLKPWNTTQLWTSLINAEFFNQGDCERAYGLDVSPFMNREDANIPKSQLSFLNFVVKPQVELWCDFCGNSGMLDTLGTNALHWQELQAAGVRDCGPVSLAHTLPLAATYLHATPQTSMLPHSSWANLSRCDEPLTSYFETVSPAFRSSTSDDLSEDQEELEAINPISTEV